MALSTSPSSPAYGQRFKQQDPARSAVLSSSAKGWAPLRVAKKPSDGSDDGSVTSYTPSLGGSSPSLTETSSPTTSPEFNQHPSAKAPRQSEAFRALGHAGLVSSSIFKHDSPNSSSGAPSPRPRWGVASPEGRSPTMGLGSPDVATSASKFKPMRTVGQPSQMASALASLGFGSPTSPTAPTTPRRPAGEGLVGHSDGSAARVFGSSNNLGGTQPAASNRWSVGTENETPRGRAGDEPAQRRGPPRQSSAYNALSRSNPVSASPFVKSDSTSSISAKGPPHADSDDNHSTSDSSGTESDLHRPRTPSPTRAAATGGVLKTSRLGGPRSYAPSDDAGIGLGLGAPIAFSTRGGDELAVADEDDPDRPPSALSTPGRRRERRKTVTWGGEDVLEFERDDSSRVPSGTSSSGSRSSIASESSSEPEEEHYTIGLRSRPQEGEEVAMGGRLVGVGAKELAEDVGDGGEFWKRGGRNPRDDSLANLSLGDTSRSSFIEHSQSARSLDGIEEADSTAERSASQSIDPTARMIDQLLKSPELDHLSRAGHATGGQSFDLSMGLVSADTSRINVAADDRTVEGASVSVLDGMKKGHSEESISAEEKMRLDDAKEEAEREGRKAAGQDDAGAKQKTGSRFPYLSSLWGGAPTTPKKAEAGKEQEDDGKTPVAKRVEKSPSSAAVKALDDLIHEEEASFAASLVEHSLGPDSTFMSNAEGSPTRGMRQSTVEPEEPPRPTPSPNRIGRARSSTLAQPPTADGNRPLPRPPPMESLAASRSESTYSLPDIQTVSPLLMTPGASAPPMDRASASEPRPALVGLGVEDGNGSLLANGSVRGRQRITRERIAAKMRGDRTSTPTTALARDAQSHAASLHELGASVNGAVPRLPSPPMVVELSPARDNKPRAIPARPPLRARAATLSDTRLPLAAVPGVDGQDTALRQEALDEMTSGLERLANGLAPPGTPPTDLFAPSPEISASKRRADEVVDEDEANWDDEIRDQVLPDDLSDSKKVPIGGARQAVRRRSLSTGGATLSETGSGAGTRAAVRSNSIKKVSVGPLSSAYSRTDFGTSLDRALQQVFDSRDRTYRIQEREDVVHATDDKAESKVETIGDAGDVAKVRNWRKLRKPSDINEHEKAMRAFWAGDHAKQYGRVNVRMSKLSLTGVPTPTRPTYFEAIIDNGRDTVNAGSFRLGRDVSFDVEFELARYKNLEFSLAFIVSPNDPRNAHLRAVNQPTVAAQAPESPRKGGLRSIFNSPKKTAKHAAAAAPLREPLLASLDRQGRLAQALIVFDEVADQCLGRQRTFVFPVVPSFGAPCGSMRRSPSGSVGHVTLEMVYIPPLPEVRGSELPSKGEDWMQGLKTAEWWRQIWCEGSLNQMGADCPVWRRRSFKAIGGSLFAYNDVLNRPIAEICLSEAVKLEDCCVLNADGLVTSSYLADTGEYFPPYTFKVIFRDGSEVLFHPDDADGFKLWRNVIGRVMKNLRPRPDWAEHLRLAIEAERDAAKESDRSVQGVHRRREPLAA